MLVLDAKLTAWQLYEMAIDPNFEPILDLIAHHEHAYAELQAWYAHYQATGEVEVVPKPAEPERTGWRARKGKLPSLQQVDVYAMTLHESDAESSDGDRAERGQDHGEAPDDTSDRLDVQQPQPAAVVDGGVESFDDSVQLAFDWRIVKRIGLVVAVCALFAGLCGVGVHWYRHAQRQQIAQAQADCQVSIQQVQARQRAWQRLVDAASIKQMLAYQEQDVVDKHVLAQLRAATHAPDVSVHSCTSESQLQDATDANTAVAATIQERIHALRKAVQLVQSSHRAQLRAQRGELQVAINGAQALLDSSSGKVADNATRDALQKAVDAARTTYDDKHVSDVEQYVNAGKALVDAQQAVQASIDAQVQADEQAQQQAAHDAQAPAEDSTSSSQQYVHSPQPTVPSQPATPQQGSKSAQAQSAPADPPTWSVPAPSTNSLPDNDGSL